MAGGETPVRHRLADRGGQLEEAHGVGHRGAVLPHPFGHLLLGEGEVVRQPLVPLGELDGVQIRPLDVFHQRGFERLPVGEPAHHRRDGGKPRGLRGAKPALAGDQFIPVRGRPDQHRLKNPFLPDRGGELFERFR